jgi:hypothetical protein
MVKPTMWAKDMNSRQISAETSAVETVYNNLMQLIQAIKHPPKDSNNKPTQQGKWSIRRLGRALLEEAKNELT